MKRIMILIVNLILVIALLTGCQREVKQLSRPCKGDTVAEIVVKDYGTIKVKLFPDAAPKAVENFITHAKDGYYNDLSFYRIIQNSIIETGDPSNTGNGGESIWDKDFEDEFSPKLQPYYGALCMSNIGPDTNSSRFFIVQAQRKYSSKVLDQLEDSYDIKFSKTARKNYSIVGGAPWFYRLNTVFGQVYEGFGVLNNISMVKKTDPELGIPAEKVIVEKINIVKYQK